MTVRSHKKDRRLFLRSFFVLCCNDFAISPPWIIFAIQLIWLRGDVAQLVEHRTENPCVGGSSPSISTKNPQHLPGVFVFESFGGIAPFEHPVGEYRWDNDHHGGD